MSDLLLPGYDRWLDCPFERDMDARVEDAEMDATENRERHERADSVAEEDDDDD